MATVTTLKVLDSEVVASAQDGTYVYLATNKGQILKYAISGGAVTTLAALSGNIKSMSLYSGVLYVGMASGDLKSVTTT